MPPALHLAGDAEALVEDLYRGVQLPQSWVDRLTEELEVAIVVRQAGASDHRVVLTEMLASSLMSEESSCRPSTRTPSRRTPSRSIS